MNTDTLTRSVVEALAGRGIRKIAQDPERGLRALVDIGAAAARGRFQRHYMNVIQGALADENCPYYEMVCRTARQTEERNLRTFGVNVGWQSWTVGARRIRDCEAANGFDVPWSMTFHMGGGGDGADWSALVRSGQECGIWTYFLHAGGDLDAAARAAALAEGAPACAFLLFVSQESVYPLLEELTALDNVMTVVDTAGGDWRRAAAALREERRLYGLWRLCAADGDADAAERWLEEIQYEGALAAFLLPGPACTAAGRARLSRLAEATWRSRRYPMLVFDYYKDILLVDEIISDRPCFAGVLPDGRATIYRDGQERPEGADLRKVALTEALRLQCARSERAQGRKIV